MEDVTNGMVISGAGNPALLIYDGDGPGGGSLLFGIDGFKRVEVKIKAGVTTLHIEGKMPVKIPFGIVRYVAERS